MTICPWRYGFFPETFIIKIPFYRRRRASVAFSPCDYSERAPGGNYTSAGDFFYSGCFFAKNAEKNIIFWLTVLNACDNIFRLRQKVDAESYSKKEIISADEPEKQAIRRPRWVSKRFSARCRPTGFRRQTGQIQGCLFLMWRYDTHGSVVVINGVQIK